MQIFSQTMLSGYVFRLSHLFILLLFPKNIKFRAEKTDNDDINDEVDDDDKTHVYLLNFCI